MVFEAGVVDGGRGLREGADTGVELLEEFMLRFQGGFQTGLIAMAQPEIDALGVEIGQGQTGLLTPEGVGLLYLSDRARARIEPTLVGWMSVPDPEDYGNFEQDWTSGALPWETGTAPTALIHGLEASLNLLQETGVQRIADDQAKDGGEDEHDGHGGAACDCGG